MIPYKTANIFLLV